MAIPIIANSTTAVATSDALTLTIPSGVVNGDLLLILVGNDNGKAGEGFIDNTTGWTQEYSYGDGTSAAYIGLYSKIADGSNEDSVTINSTDSDDHYGWYLRVTGQHATNPVRVLGSSQTLVNSTVTITALTTDTNTYSLAFSALAFDGADGLSFTETGTGWTKQDELSQGSAGNGAGGCYSTKGILTASTTTGTSIIGASVTDGIVATQFIIAGNENEPGVVLEGEALLTTTTAELDIDASIIKPGKSTFTTTTADVDPTAQMILGGNLDISGDATVEPTGGKILTGELDISGSATKLWTGGVVRTGIITLAVTTAILAADGLRDRYTGADLDGGATAIITAGLDASAQLTISGSTVFNIYETLEYTMGDIRGLTTGEVTIDTPAADLEVDGTVTAGGGVDEFGEAILTTTTASFDIDAYCIRNANLSWTGSGILEVDASPDRFASATFATATGTIEANAYEIFNAKPTFTTTTATLDVNAYAIRNANSTFTTATATLDSDAFAIRNADTELVGTTTLDVDMYSEAFAKLNTSAAATLDIDAEIIFSASIPLSGDATLEGSGYSLAYAGVLWTTAADIEINATEIFNAKSNLSGDAIFEVDASIDRFADTSLITSATVSDINASIDRFADTSLDGISSLDIDGSPDRFADLDISATTSLDIDATCDRFADINLYGTGILSTDAIEIFNAKISLFPEAEITIDGTIEGAIEGEIDLFATSSLDVDAYEIFNAKLDISSDASLDINASPDRFADVDLDGTAEITIDGLLDKYSSSDFTTTTATLNVSGEEDRFASASISASALLDIDGTLLGALLGEADFTTTAALESTASVIREANFNISSTVIITTDGNMIKSASLNINSSVTFNADGYADRFAFIDLSSSSTLIVDSDVDVNADISLLSASSLDINAITIKSASINLDAFADIDIDGTLEAGDADFGEVSLSSDAILDVYETIEYTMGDIRQAQFDDSEFTTTATLVVDAIEILSANINIEATAILSASLGTVYEGKLDISSSTSMFTIGELDGFPEGRTSFSSTSSINIDSEVDRNAASSLEPGSELTVNGRSYGLPVGEYNISASSNLDITAGTTKIAYIDLSQVSVLSARGIADVNAAMSISATTSVISDTTLIYEAKISLSSFSTMSAIEEYANYGKIDLLSNSTLSASVSKCVPAKLDISSDTTLLVRGFNLGDNIWRHEGISTLNVDTIIIRNAIAHLEQTTEVDFQGAVDIGGQDPFISFYMSVF